MEAGSTRLLRPQDPEVRPLQARSIPVSRLRARPAVCRTGRAGLGCTRHAGVAHPVTTARVARITDRRMQLEVPFPDEDGRLVTGYRRAFRRPRSILKRC